MLKSVASGGGGGTADTTTFDDTGLEYVTGADVQEALENADAAIVAATKSPVNFRLQQLCNSVTNINSLWCSPIQSGSGATGFQGQISSVEASAQGGGIFIGEYGSTGTTSTGYGYLRIIGSQTLNVLGDGVVFGMEVLFRIPDLGGGGPELRFSSYQFHGYGGWDQRPDFGWGGIWPLLFHGRCELPAYQAPCDYDILRGYWRGSGGGHLV